MAAAAKMGCRLKRILVFLLTAAFAPGATYYVTVAGLGGEPDYEQRFASLAKETEKLVANSPDVKVITLCAPDSTKAKLQSVIAEISKTATPEDSLVLFLIGHGTFDGLDYKFNLPGPDITAVELAALLDRVRARQLVVNTTSASGASFDSLRRENRAIITATKSGTERNATVFARYWVEALRDPGADSDKNEVVTALEAFRYADQKTVSFYETQKRLATEHAMLEDTGKGEPARAPSPENGQGLLAARFPVLRLGAVQKATLAPEKQQLLTKKEELERQIDELKYRKAAMDSNQYKVQLSALLLQLAQVQKELDQ